MEHNPDAPWYRRLHWQVLIAMVLGALVGAQFGEPMADRVGWIGDLFMKLLRMIIVPLVMTSIISGVASVGGGRALGRLFSKTMGYYVLSSFLAASVGLLMVNLIRPGVGANLTGTEQHEAAGGLGKGRRPRTSEGEQRPVGLAHVVATVYLRRAAISRERSPRLAEESHGAQSGRTLVPPVALAGVDRHGPRRPGRSPVR